MNWYKDRDFPELKREIQGNPSEILAIITNHEHLDAVVKAHNEEIEEILHLAEIWKKGYEDETKRLKRKIIELEQIVESLEEELRVED
jgi:predicted nuclease with TOPRIM domain